MEENELPDGWVWTTIGQITKVNPGLSISTIPDETLVSFVPMAAVEAGSGIIDVTTTRPLGEVKRGYTAFQNGDVLFAKITPCMENGKAGVAHSLSSNIGFGSTEFHVLRPEINTPSQFLYFYLSQESFRQQARTYMTGSAGQLRVPAAFLVEASFPLAPLSEQQRIVAAIEQQFTRLDAGVAALKSLQIRLKRYRAAVLKAAVEGKLTEAWRTEHPTSEPASQLLTRILQERRAKWEADLRAKGKDPTKVKYVEPAAPDVRELDELPEGWCWGTVHQLASAEKYSLAIGPFGSNLKVEDYRDYGVPLIFVRNIRSMTFDGPDTRYINFDKAQELQAHQVIGGDILITKMGDPPGDACLYPEFLPCAIITADCIKWTLSPLLLKKAFFVNTINSAIVKTQILGITKGVAQLKVSLGRFETVCVPLPPLEEQQQIISEVERRLSVVSQLEAAVEANLKRAERLRQSILKEAFAGRLVPQNPDDEPASVLLERIRQEREEREAQGASSERKGRTQSKEQRTHKKSSDEHGKSQATYAPTMTVHEPEQIDVDEIAQVALWSVD